MLKNWTVQNLEHYHRNQKTLTHKNYINMRKVTIDFPFMFHADYIVLIDDMNCHVDNQHYSWTCYFPVNSDLVQNNSMMLFTARIQLKRRINGKKI